MPNFKESRLLATNGDAYSRRSLAWGGAPIRDACTVQADYGNLLLLTANGTLFGINIDTGTSVQLCAVCLPDIACDGNNEYFGGARYRLHASSDGRYAAIVVDYGRNGIVVEIPSGTVTMRLDGGDHHEETVPFSACFLRSGGHHVFVHRTAWNRLDAADPATGKSLTDRYIAPYEEAGKTPAHYLDYFHGELRPSPKGDRIFDDGWVWHPVSVPRCWSVTAWLGGNPWESEDGSSVVDLTLRDDWNTPACWIGEQHVAVWGLGNWDEDEGSEIEQGTGVRILDVTERKQSSARRWPMETAGIEARALFSDGACLYVAADTGTIVWDIASRTQIKGLPGFVAHLHDQARDKLIELRPDEIIELSLLRQATK